ncbi:hypothetical protein ACFQZO_15100 [Bradyrhizobium sp. GCM10027634]|uniref:hypothetical protein n=1 Tax=unclassified Bradyrhizobium TaxID=2631580 RepID=UPI00188D3064|nr:MULTISPECIES: hypothetical protein [unclassified Bradyrhizobium]MDN5002213.1 hypothetical protein [Bradyrhizobium sp. WYCCWR 12677]
MGKTQPQPEIIKRIASLSGYARFGFSGLAFGAGRLYVATNIGLIELQGTSIKSLHTWYPSDDVVEGPWFDETSLWIQHVHDGVLRRLDDAGWHPVALPPPPNAYGYYTRRDMAEGFHVTSDSTGPRLIGADHVWAWKPPDRWSIESSPAAPEYSGSVGVAFFRGREARIMRLGSCFGGPLPCDYAYYWRGGDGWSEARTLPLARPRQVLGTADGIFARGDKGELVRLDDIGAVVLETPGPCEAIARTSVDKLTASFVGAGIFTLSPEGWTKVLASPYGPSEGEHWAYLAEKDGVIAYATTSMPTHDGKREAGTTALWVAEAGNWTRIDVEQAAKN